MTTRRTVLTTAAATIGGAAGTAALAACGSGEGTSSADSAGSQTPVTTPGATVAALSDIAVGQSKSVTVQGHPAIVARPSANDVVAFSAICTHQGCTVMPDGSELKCPCHGSQYNAFTGAVQHGPAPLALSPIPVKVDNGNIVTA